MSDFSAVCHNTSKKCKPCYHCGEAIKPGEKQAVVSGVYGGDFFSVKFHEECEGPAAKLCDPDTHEYLCDSYEGLRGEAAWVDHQNPFDGPELGVWYKCSIGENHKTVETQLPHYEQIARQVTVHNKFAKRMEEIKNVKK